jgi:hypothetical protein
MNDNRMAHELQYRKDQRTIANLSHENQLLRNKIITMTIGIICMGVIFVVALLVNMSK